MKTIYLDNAATTAVNSRVFNAMKPYLLYKYGNPSEFHKLGKEARMAVEEARLTVAKFLRCSSAEIIFTSSATESINLAIKGLIEEIISLFQKDQKPEIITTLIEHKAVLETCKHLEESGLVNVKYIAVDKFGKVSVNELKKAISPKTVLVSIGYVNNEVGTIQPVKEIAQSIKDINKNRKNKIKFHTDATQAVKYLNRSVHGLGVDMLSFSGHKIGAPKGIGVLFKSKNTTICRQMDGGFQENGLRSGTENVANIVGLGQSIKEIIENKSLNNKVRKLRKLLIKGVLMIKGVRLTGHPVSRVPHIASFTMKNVEGEGLVLALSDLGIIVSSGSACMSGNLNASHVLTAMGISSEEAHGSLRFSLGEENTEDEIKYVLQKLPLIIEKLRNMSPFN